MRKVLYLTVCIVLTISILAGCGVRAAEEAPEPAEAPVAEEPAEEEPVADEPAQAEADEPEPTQDPDYIPAEYSPTTGREGNTEYRPVIVQIENEEPARPQAGLQWADVVYETMIEGADTRFTCIYNDILWGDDSPKELEVGPVRSTRYYHQWIQGEWDGLYVHMGGSETPDSESYIWGPSSEHVRQRINAAGKKPSNANLIYRREGTGKRLEHTAYTELHADAEIINYQPEMREPFLYYPRADYSAQPEVKDIKLGFWREPGFVEYRYDANSGKLVRYMDGKEFIAEETEKALTVQNVIVQYTSISDMPDEGGRKKIEMFGEGDAEFFIDGRHIQGKWQRENNANAPTKYYDESGEEIVLVPGNTWIEIHPDTTEVVVDYADGTSYSRLDA